MTKSKLLSIFAVMALAFAMMLGLAGCGGSEPEAEKEAPAAEDQATEESGILTVGEKAEGVEAILFSNKTGADITAVEVAKSGSESGNKLKISGEKWANTEDAEVYFKAESGAKYDVKITCDKEELTLHDVDFTELAEADGDIILSKKEGIAYLQYAKDGKTVSTFDAEKAIANPESEATEEEAEEDAEGNGEAAKQAEEEQPVEVAYEEEVVYEEPVYEEPAYEEPAYEEPVYEEPAYVEPAPAPEAPAQSGDQCVTDVVLN